MPADHRIAVLLPNWVGDVVMATPALRAISEMAGAENLALAGRAIALATLQGTDWAGMMIEDTSQDGLGELLATAGRIRAFGADTIVLLPNSFRAATLARLAGARRVVGYGRDGRGWLLTDPVRPPRNESGNYQPAPMLDYYNRLVEAVWACDPGYSMQLPVSPPHEAQAEDLLNLAGCDGDRPVMIVNPGGSFGKSKMWSPNRYGRLADRLVEQFGAQIIINVAPNEKAIARQVAEAMQNKPLLNFADRDNSLPLLTALCRRADLMVTNDTGARHIAIAAGMNVVTLYGSTDPRWTHLYTSRDQAVRVEIPCSPCQQKLCPLPAGPMYHKCMTEITVEMVFDACCQFCPSPAGGG